MLKPTTISAAIFSPQSSAPKSAYLTHIRSRLVEVTVLKPLLDALVGLPETWHTLSSSRQDLAALKGARRLVQTFPDWIQTGKSETLESDLSGIITLPLLITIQIVQYFDYLKKTGNSHADLLKHLQYGGVQGYCIGLLSAIVVASSKTEEELAKNAATAVRIALGIGAFGDVGQGTSSSEPTTLVIRLKTPGNGEDLVRRFPGVSRLIFISGGNAVTDLYRLMCPPSQILEPLA